MKALACRTLTTIHSSRLPSNNSLEPTLAGEAARELFQALLGVPTFIQIRPFRLR
jgi:hypothetical protein